jgi:hypothetical protein
MTIEQSFSDALARVSTEVDDRTCYGFWPKRLRPPPLTPEEQAVKALMRLWRPPGAILCLRPPPEV